MWILILGKTVDFSQVVWVVARLFVTTLMTMTKGVFIFSFTIFAPPFLTGKLFIQNKSIL